MTAPLLDSQLTEERCDGAMDAETYGVCVENRAVWMKVSRQKPIWGKNYFAHNVYIHTYLGRSGWNHLSLLSHKHSLIKSHSVTHQISLTHTHTHTHNPSYDCFICACSQAAVSVVGAVMTAAHETQMRLQLLYTGYTSQKKTFKLMLLDILSDENFLEMYAKRKSLGLNWEKLWGWLTSTSLYLSLRSMSRW